MINVVPALTPLTIPEPAPTVATAVVLLLHAPNNVVLDNGVVRPIHTFVVPVIAAGNGLTVTTAVLIQPVGNV